MESSKRFLTGCIAVSNPQICPVHSCSETAASSLMTESTTLATIFLSVSPVVIGQRPGFLQGHISLHAISHAMHLGSAEVSRCISTGLEKLRRITAIIRMNVNEFFQNIQALRFVSLFCRTGAITVEHLKNIRRVSCTSSADRQKKINWCFEVCLV